MTNNVFIEFQDFSYLAKFKEVRPEIRSLIYLNFEYGFEVAKNLDLYGISISTNDISAEQIKQAHDEGIRVSLFGMHTTKKNLDAIKKNPDFLQTDRVKHLVKVLK